MRAVLKKIQEGLKTPGRIFVFPSQVVADFWRLEVLKNPLLPEKTPRALAWDRFISWDKFKEARLKIRRSQPPANDTVRRLFCCQFLNRLGRGEAALARLIAPRSAGKRENLQVFGDYLAGILPLIKNFFSGPAEKLRASGPENAALTGDIGLIYGEYQKFLERLDYYEPAWEDIPFSSGGDYLIFFPELIKDFPPLAETLQRAPGISLLTLGEAEEEGESIRPVYGERYANSRLEAENFILRVAALEPEDRTGAAVTLADDDLWNMLEHQARIHGIPLSKRKGFFLGETPEGLFYKRLRALSAGHYSLAAFKDLLLNRAYPFKDGPLINALIRFGIENNCVSNIPPGPKNSGGGFAPGRDLWEEAFAAARPPDSALVEKWTALYRGIQKNTEALCRAESFHELSRQVQIFLETFLETRLWDPQGLKTLKRTRLVLRDLVHLEERAAPLELPSRIDFFIRELNAASYVPQEEEPAIPVFSYGVSAGIFPEKHYILGLSRRTADLSRPPFPFLREDQAALAGCSEVNPGPEFLRAYGLSGAEVWFSYARESFRGPELIPDGPGGREGEAFFVPPPVLSGPYQGEPVWWTGEGPLLPLTETQRKGLLRAGVSVFDPPAGNSGIAPVRDPSLSALLQARLKNGETGAYRASPTGLDDFFYCPFFYYVKHILGVGEENLSAEWESPRALGSLRHEILKRIFKPLKDESFAGYPPDSEALKKICQKVLSAPSFRLTTPAGEALCEKLVLEMEEFFQSDAQVFGGWGVEALEEPLRLVKNNVELTGRIDRVAERQGVLALVDYKSGGGEAFFSRTQEGLVPFSYQMPLYIFMWEELGKGKIEKAAYYFFKSGRYKFMAGGEGRSSLPAGELKGWGEKALQDFTQNLDRLDFPFSPDCSGRVGCRLRSLCRNRYFLRGPHDQRT